MLASSKDIHIIRYTDVVSTNLLAHKLGEQGTDHGTVVVSEQQSAGRGRMAREFSSPPGGLYFSLILRPKIDPKYASFLTLAAGVACCKVIEDVSGLSIMLKWPNDLYIDSRKLGGILTETAPYSNITKKIPFIVVGIGLNINTRPEKFPHSLRDSITSLYYIQNQQYDLEPIMTDIVLQLDRYACNLSSLRTEICGIWQQRDYLYGKKINWQGVKGGVIQGTGAGLLDDGRYQLKKEDGTVVPIIGGELSLVDNK